MRLDSEHYYHAALERIRQARVLYERGGSYALAMYVAGVSSLSMRRRYGQMIIVMHPTSVYERT